MGTARLNGRLQRKKLETLAGTSAAGDTSGTADTQGTATATADTDGADQAGEVRPLPARPTGPFDASEIEEAVGYVDLGPLLLPGRRDVEMRVSLDDRGVPSDLLIVHAGWHLRLEVFAAPRSEGTWAKVSHDVVASLAAQGIEASFSPGPFGPQVQAEVPGQDEFISRLRIIGVDGPGWLLRATLQSVPDTDDAAATGPGEPGAGGGDVDGLPAGPLGEIIRGAVVRRGSAPLPSGAPLPLVIDPTLLGQPATVDRPADVPANRFAYLPGLWA